MSRASLAALAAVIVASSPPLAFAQQAASFADVPTMLRPHQRVVVTDRGGGKVRGTLVDVSSSAITLRVSDSLGAERLRTVQGGTVGSIRLADRLWNGLLIGAAVGFAATEVWRHNVCGPRDNDSECTAIATSVGWVSFVPAGALAGALIDKAIGNRLVYRATPTAPAVRLSPVIAPTAVGLTAAVRF